MSFKRVQKLLFSEYCDFEDMVLIESPFAQTTKEGRGIRQVHLGLTPSKLVLARDVLPPVENSSINFIPGIDPDIETFELIAIYPIDCVNLSIYRRNKRQALKAHFCNNKVYYFELGGFETRTMLWNLWCEKVKFLSPEVDSSQSETSVATSSTNSTLYLIDRKQIRKPNGTKQLWYKFGTGKDILKVPKWTDRYLFAGSSDYKYKPMIHSPLFSDFLKKPPVIWSDYSNVRLKNSNSLAREIHVGDSYHINRFGIGVGEGCARPLYLPAENYISPNRYSQVIDQTLDYDILRNVEDVGTVDLEEQCVKQWESRRSRVRHRRRYGLSPQPLFLNGLGPWKVSAGCQFTIQMKRAVSAVTIRKQPNESEMRLLISRRQLISTISCQTMNPHDLKLVNRMASHGNRLPVLLFWTPHYWYRPRTAKESYDELQNHLANIKTYQQKPKKRRLFRRRAAPPPKCESTDSELEAKGFSKDKQKRRKSVLGFSLGGKSSHQTNQGNGDHKISKQTYLEYMRNWLKVEIVLSAWDFGSTILAQQLTLIDRDLFLKIMPIELSILLNEQSSRNAPNVAALIAFSHRISCLVATDILKNDCERMRARMIARFINLAFKCHKMSNFQSCRSVLFGLQSPGIYRLRITWAYLRKKHASKYENFELLSKLYRDPRLFSYQKAFHLISQATPYLPYIGDLIAKLLDNVPNYAIKQSELKTDECPRAQSLFSQLMISMRLLNFGESQEQIEKRRALCDYFDALHYANNKVKCLQDTTQFLQNCQLGALHYNFPVNEIVIDYLLKARYKEERENFFNSIRIEKYTKLF